MLRRTIIFAVAAALIALFIYAGFLRDYANAIDNLHWAGFPLPPCFVNAAMCGGHVLGTDEVGRDLLARLIVATRVSLGLSFAGAVAEFGLLLCALFIGRRVAGWARSAMAWTIQGVSCFSAWPLLLVVALMAFDLEIRSSVRLPLLALIAGMLIAARSMPELTRRAPSWPFVTGQAVRDWAAIMLMLATIDFFGLGIQPPVPSWGNMLVTLQADFGIAWWAAVFPALFIFAAALLMEIGARAILSDLTPQGMTFRSLENKR